jgi:hypothetical protein
VDDPNERSSSPISEESTTGNRNLGDDDGGSDVLNQEAVAETLGYITDPKDPHNKKETDKAEAFLNQLPGCRTTRPCRYNGLIQFWVVYNSKQCFNH